MYRCAVVTSIKPVDRVILSIDTDATVCATLTILLAEAISRPDVTEVIFTKGGDRFAAEIPERIVCDRFDVAIIDALGEKTHSSSEYVARATYSLIK